MSWVQKSRVGSKGELFPPKAMRDKLGLKACSEVVFTVESGRLIVEQVPPVKDMIAEGISVEMSLEDFHQSRRELSKLAES